MSREEAEPRPCDRPSKEDYRDGSGVLESSITPCPECGTGWCPGGPLVTARNGSPMSDKPMPTGLKPENPCCMKCSKHLSKPFHETSEHPE